jgi:hypothetical protein
LLRWMNSTLLAHMLKRLRANRAQTYNDSTAAEGGVLVYGDRGVNVRYATTCAAAEQAAARLYVVYAGQCS